MIKGLARAGNLRVRHTMIQLAWRWLQFQDDSALTRWFRQRTENASAVIRKKMIVALARKLLVALWRYVEQGELPEGAEEKDWRLCVSSTARRHAKAAAELA